MGKEEITDRLVGSKYLGKRRFVLNENLVVMRGES